MRNDISLEETVIFWLKSMPKEQNSTANISGTQQLNGKPRISFKFSCLELSNDIGVYGVSTAS